MRAVPTGAETLAAPALPVPPMRLAICSSGEIWGGVEQCIVTLSQGLKALNVQSVAILFHDGLLARKLRRLKFDVEVLDGYAKYDPRTIGRLRRLLQHRRIDVLHLHGYKATIVGGLAALGTRVAVVKTEHGRVEPLPAWSALRGYCKLQMNRVLDRIISQFLTDAVVFVSQDIERGVGLRTSRIQRRTIYNGIEPLRASARDQPPGRRNDGEFHIGIVGRIDKVKGHAHLIHALARLNHLQGLRLHVLGAGPLEAECRRQCHEAGVADRVCFHGFQESIHEHMRNLDLLVMPSLHEGLPYTLLEAMYLKVPVIASGVGGLREVIVDDQSGVLVAAGDEQALAAAIERQYRNPELRSRLAQDAFRRVSRHFLAPEMVRQYAELYAHLLPKP